MTHNLHLPHRLCSNTQIALQREWLVTNGLGGFASGTVAGALTRRYHGLLLAALCPPVGRVLLVTKLDDTVTVDGRPYQLYTNVWRSGVEQPAGVQYLDRFDLVWGVPTWTYQCGRARLVKRIWMEPGRNATFVQFQLESGSPRIHLAARLLVNDRDYHWVSHGGDPNFKAAASGPDFEIHVPHSARPIGVRCTGDGAAAATWKTDYTWCHNFHLSVEAQRGYDHLDSHLVIGLCRVPLKPGATITFVIGAGDDRTVSPRGALKRFEDRAQACVATWAKHTQTRLKTAPAALRQLVLAADQFVVARPTPKEPDGHTLIAGYPWFTDWGRDTMIALPGLTLVTGRAAIARRVLRTWARYVSEGLIPNRFPDEGSQPEYNTADATLWFLWAIDQYFRATADTATLAELFPVMQQIIERHRHGTRHHIRVDDDGLVQAGDEGCALTWMDAKMGDRVFTPRRGKPVELSALWYDALCNLARLAEVLEEPNAEYVQLAQRTQHSFDRFWNPRRGCCYDVLDGPAGYEELLRPNQIFAVSLSHSPLSRERQEAVVRMCEHELLTPYGLRTLGRHEPGYRTHYTGGLLDRDEAYHQGAAWGWLLGPFVQAHYRLYHDRALAGRLLEPMLGQLWRAQALGTLCEVFDAEPPHAAGGCCAQAWSVAETLRAWHVTQT